jgi:PmbA protein
MQDLLRTLEEVVRFCETQGAEAEVVGITKKEITVTLEKNDIKLCIKQHTAGIGIRTLIKNSVGFSSCNSLEEDLVKEKAQKAIDMSKRTPPLPFSVFASPGPLPEIAGLYDPEIQRFDEETAISTAEGMITTAREDPRVLVDSGEFTVAIGEKAASNSSGVSVSERKSMISWFLAGMAQEHGGIGPFEYQYGCAAQTSRVYCEETARTLAENAVANLHPQKIESFSGDLILGPEAVSTLIYDPVTFSVNAAYVHTGQSILAGALNESIASEVVTIKDHPLLPADFNSSRFDREGTPHQALTVVKNGVLQSFMYNALAANRESRASTGNAFGTFREIPRIGITNFMVEGTCHDHAAMIEEIDAGLLVTRFSGACDQISGDFSGAVKGQLITSGELQYPVKAVTIGGNAFEMLQKITGISREGMKCSQMTLPYIHVKEMQGTA